MKLLNKILTKEVEIKGIYGEYDITETIIEDKFYNIKSYCLSLHILLAASMFLSIVFLDVGLVRNIAIIVYAAINSIVASYNIYFMKLEEKLIIKSVVSILDNIFINDVIDNHNGIINYDIVKYRISSKYNHLSKYSQCYANKFKKISDEIYGGNIIKVSREENK